MRHLEIIRHSLGLSSPSGKEHRNHFVTGPGSKDWDDCRALAESGLMRDHGTSALYGGDHCFTVTDAGREAASGMVPA